MCKNIGEYFTPTKLSMFLMFMIVSLVAMEGSLLNNSKQKLVTMETYQTVGTK